jgi:succinate-semialdehyde dehydrogenase/glutarate-semialdehyde dehydrogenase
MNFGKLKMYVGGELIDSVNKSEKTILCPANNEPIAELSWADKFDAEKALNAAKSGFLTWSKFKPEERKGWMNKFKDAVVKNEKLLRTAIIYEMGKTYEGSKEDIDSLVSSLDFYPEAMEKYFTDSSIDDREKTHNHILKNYPVGVVVAYLAWNFPLLNLAFKIGPALASGCSIIIKPSEESPVSAYLIGKILKDIDFPAGVVNIICGEPEIVATTLSKSTIPRLITMIGSTNTAKKVFADSSSSIKRLSMELGGNAPFIVFDDANIESAIDLAVGIKFGNSGQICVAANRFFIHEKIYDIFLNKYLERVKNLKLGFGQNQKPDMGPLITSKSRERILDLIHDTLKNGGKLEYGGKIPENHPIGNWLEPTVITNVTDKMRIFNEEIFGPVAVLMKFSNDNEVLKLANKTDYGLASYIFTKSKERIDFFSENLEFGEVQVNGIKYAIYLPHGGIKESGIGHDCSYLALNDYLTKKRISVAI